MGEGCVWGQHKFSVGPVVSSHILILVNSITPEPDFFSKVLGIFPEPSLPASLSSPHLPAIILSFLSPKC